MMISGNRRIPLVYSNSKAKDPILMKYSPGRLSLVKIGCNYSAVLPIGMLENLDLSSLTFQGGTITWTFTGDTKSVIFLTVYESSTTPIGTSGTLVTTFSNNVSTGTFSFTTKENYYYIVQAYTQRVCYNNIERSLIVSSNESQYIPWTFTARDSNRYWYAVASSADGAKLAAVVSNGKIYTSTDSGVTWTERESDRSWQGIASSADGTKLAAVDYNNGQIYTSTDSGVNWTARESNRTWQCITSSADGTKLAAGVYGGKIYTSTDSGVTWTERESNRNWFSITSSSDGTKLAAVPFDGTFGASIYLSTDSGVTWAPKLADVAWRGIASSADGTRLVAAAGGYYAALYTSNDSGATWKNRLIGTSFQAVASSSSGSKVIGAVNGGQLYTGVYV
jgi:photosystem II stability/assembly factor-like uncharacterized protein